MDPKTHANMAAQIVTRDKKGKVTSTSDIALPVGLTYLQAVEFVRRYTSHEIVGFYTFTVV